jgi:Ca-activated chloride channel family protein
VPQVDAGSDILLLIDSSGSMKTTDPGNYRKEASKLFISLLGPGDRVGVMSFGDAAIMLSPLAQNSEQNRKVLFEAVGRIESRDLTTNITDAVQKGFDELKTSKQRDRVLLVMSDGKLDLGTKEKDAAALGALNTLLPELAKAKVKLYTVAFTDGSDSALLERMALETGGFFRFAKTDKDVHGMFASIFEKIKSPDSVPFEGETFKIDSEIREATVLVTKKQGTTLLLMDPAKG